VDAVTVTATFTNQNTEPTTALSVRVVLTPTPLTGQFNGAVTEVTGGFVLESIDVGAAGDLTATFVKAGPQLSGSGGPTPTATLTFDALVTGQPMPPAPQINGTVSVTPTPTPGAGTPMVGAFG
jgi:hypothetical protein